MHVRIRSTRLRRTLTWLPHFSTRLAVAIAVAVLLVGARPASAYSVLAHELMIDSAWDDVIAPMLKARFGAPDTAIRAARAYAYGGSAVQDLGYYPFGSHLFTDLLHYARSGDFVETMMREARDVNEFAFALGVLAHYTADTTGHPLATNRAVPMIYPKLRTKFGDEVTYAEDPKSHVMVEFAFDVLQVAGGSYLPEAYHDFIGFQVAVDLLERAFRETYGLEMKDLFLSQDLAIGTFRYAVGSAIPEITRVAWEQKRAEIEKLSPQAQRSTFVYVYSRREYEKEFGTSYRRPGLFARIIVWVARAMPKIGPFRTLAFRTPTPEAERLFVESFKTARDRYRARLTSVRTGLNLANLDFDTGRPTSRGEYEFADRTYQQLLERLTAKTPVMVPPAMRADILRFYGTVDPATARNRKERKALESINKALAILRGSQGAD